MAAACLAISSTPVIADGPTTADYGACLSAADLPICILQLVQQNPYLPPFSEQPEFAGSPDIIALIDSNAELSHHPRDPGEIQFQRLQEEPRRLQEDAIAQVLERLTAGQSATDVLEPIRDTAIGRDAIELMFGQIHINSGAEIRAAAYADIAARHARPETYPGDPVPDRETAYLSLIGWAEEFRTGDINTYHNEQLGADNIFYNLVEFGDGPALRQVYSQTHLGESGVDPEVAIRMEIEGPEAANALFNARDEADIIGYEATRDYLARISISRQVAAGSGESLDNYIETLPSVGPVSFEAFLTMAEHAPGDVLFRAAERLDELGRNFAEDSARYAQMAFDLWERLDEQSRGDDLMAIWLEYSREELELRACPGERSLCAKPAYYHMLARRDRTHEAFEFPGFSIMAALRLEIENGRGLENFERFRALEPQPAFPELALIQCVEQQSVRNVNRLDIAYQCLEYLDRIGGDRQPTEHEERISNMPPSDPPRYEYGPYRVAEAALTLGNAFARDDDTSEAATLLRMALSKWQENAAARVPTGAEFSLQNISTLLLVSAGRLPESAAPSNLFR